MSGSLAEQIKRLDLSMPLLQQRRASNAFANDVFESIDHWRALGQRALQGDTRVDYPVRAAEEKKLLSKLVSALRERSESDQQTYKEVFDTAREFLDQVEELRPAEEGHLGFLAIVNEVFAFLQAEYGFRVTDHQPTTIRYSTDSVYIALECSGDLSQACMFAADAKPDPVFWLADLLYLYGDPRYRSLPNGGALETRIEVEEWFAFIAGLWRQYGRDVLTNQAGIFDRLAEAQAKRDAEYIAAMNEKYWLQ